MRNLCNPCFLQKFTGFCLTDFQEILFVHYAIRGYRVMLFEYYSLLGCDTVESQNAVIIIVIALGISNLACHTFNFLQLIKEHCGKCTILEVGAAL
jgi:hypothetical protein